MTEELMDLLAKINEVPFTDERDSRQLSILMNGFAQLNNKAMDNAATKTRAQIVAWDLDEAVAAEKKEKTDISGVFTRLKSVKK